MRYSFVLLVLVLMPSFNFAQSSKVDVSIQVGMNTSSFTNRIGPYGDGEPDSYKEFVRYSPKIGLGVLYKLNRLYSVQTELNFSAQGGSYRMKSEDIVDLLDETNKAYFYKNYRVNYFEVPLLFTVNLSNLIHKDYPEGKINAVFSAGTAFSINTASSLRYNGFEASGSGNVFESVEEEYDVEEIGHAQNNVSYVFNFGVNFFMKKLPAFVNLRYQRTMLNVYDVQELDGYNMQTKMGTFTVSFGLMFKRKE